MDTQEKMDWIINRTAKILNIENSKVSYFFFGGPDTNLEIAEYWENLGFDVDGLYSGNREFWESIFITEEEHDFIIESAE